MPGAYLPSTATIANNIAYNNTEGGFSAAAGTFTHNTVYNNGSTGVQNAASIINSIVYKNTTAQLGSGITATYSDVQGIPLAPGDTNIDNLPQFRAVGTDFSLIPGSAGTAGTANPASDGTDMGAYGVLFQAGTRVGAAPGLSSQGYIGSNLPHVDGYPDLVDGTDYFQTQTPP